MSNVMMSCTPASRAVTWAPTTPVLGPDSTVRTGSRAAVSKSDDATIGLRQIRRRGDAERCQPVGDAANIDRP